MQWILHWNRQKSIRSLCSCLCHQVGGGCVNCQATLVPVWPSPPASEIQCEGVGTSSWDCWHEMLAPDSQSQGQPQKAIMGGLWPKFLARHCRQPWSKVLHQPGNQRGELVQQKPCIIQTCTATGCTMLLHTTQSTTHSTSSTRPQESTIKTLKVTGTGWE